jgi:imidazoleglycerol-phosphate dehydratase
MRQTTLERNTNETKIVLSLNLDGSGISKIDSGCGFLDHMLTLFAKHGRFDLNVTCQGDTQVDDHHTAEDIGICLGTAFAKAVGDCRGIKRYGSMMLPMDESLILCALDVSGRSYLAYDCAFPTEKISSFDTELIKEFWLAFTRTAGITLHMRKLAGENSHHIAEAGFKAVARALREAVTIETAYADEIPSTKGILV